MVDEHTVTVVFTGPVSFPYAAFVSSSSPILQALQFSGCLGTAAAGCTDANHGPIGTGPYVVAEFHSNESVRYQFNPQYRGVEAGQPYFREVVLQGGGDAVAAARSVLELNEADYAWNLQIEPEILNSLEAGGGGTVVSAFATSVERLMLNQTNPDPSLGDLRSEYADGTNPHPFLTDPVVGRALSAGNRPYRTGPDWIWRSRRAPNVQCLAGPSRTSVDQQRRVPRPEHRTGSGDSR